MKVLTFSIDNTHYALSIVSILQVIRERCVVDMPYDTTWFTGIIQYEDMMIPVLNLKQPLKDCSDESSDEHLRRTIVLEVNGHAVGLGVDQTYRVISIDEQLIEDFPHFPDRPVYITGAFHHGDTLVFMIEPEKFFSEDFHHAMDKVESCHQKKAESHPRVTSHSRGEAGVSERDS